MRNILFATLFVFAFVQTTRAQWLGTGPIYYNGGSVGIGISNPWTKLQLYGGDFSVVGTDLNGTAMMTSRGGAAFFGNNVYNNGLAIAPSGFIGIGTSTPAYQFDISSPDNSIGATRLRIANTVSSATNAPGSFPAIEVLGARGDGNTTFEGRLALGTRTSNGTVPLTNQTLGAVLFGGQYGTDQTFQAAKILYPASVQGVAEGGFTAAAAMPTGIAFFTGAVGNDLAAGNLSYGTERMRINNLGNVGIGTSTPGSYKLAVEGTVGARKVIVTQASWSDYVFDDNYHLPSLSEVGKFIHRNKHLPDVPAEATIKEKGLDVGDNQALLLKKIEELTLYVLRQEQQLERQAKEIGVLKQQNKKIIKKLQASPGR